MVEYATLRVVIASDNFLTREGLTCLLGAVPGIEVVARVDSHPQTLEAAQKYAPDVLVVGIRTPRVRADAALASARKLRADHPAIGVVVIAEAGDGYALELLRNGAAGIAYLLDDRVGDLQILVGAIREVHAGETLLDPSIVNALVRRRLATSLDVLTLRELDVLAEMAKGYANNEIAKTSPSRRRPSKATSPTSSASCTPQTPRASTAGSRLSLLTSTLMVRWAIPSRINQDDWLTKPVPELWLKPASLRES